MASGEQRLVTTLEVLEPQDLEGAQVSALVTKSDNGAVRRGTLENIDGDTYTIYGIMFGGRGEGEPRTIPYTPPVEFSSTVKLGETQEAEYKSTMRERENTGTMTLELAAVEDVTVPKGAFEDCLKIVVTTKFGDRERPQTAWYAKGVGVVKTERQGRDGETTTSELADYKLAE